MKPTIEALQNKNQFEQIAQIDLHNPTPFFKNYGQGWFIKAFIGLLMLGIGYLGGSFGAKIAKGLISLSDAPLQALVAFAFMFVVLLPIHEGIHAITYWLIGAKDVRFSFSKKGFAVFTVANRHVVHLREYPLLAAAPFVIITTVLVILMAQFPNYLTFFTVLVIIHSIACAGDMMLIDFAIKNWKKEIYNYDDFDEKKSYFFETVK
ncbi:MAG: DUF3267 domain-containing protein [Spirosomataceae bacterium]